MSQLSSIKFASYLDIVLTSARIDTVMRLYHIGTLAEKISDLVIVEVLCKIILVQGH